MLVVVCYASTYIATPSMCPSVRIPLHRSSWAPRGRVDEEANRCCVCRGWARSVSDGMAGWVEWHTGERDAGRVRGIVGGCRDGGGGDSLPSYCVVGNACVGLTATTYSYRSWAEWVSEWVGVAGGVWGVGRVGGGNVYDAWAVCVDGLWYAWKVRVVGYLHS